MSSIKKGFKIIGLDTIGTLQFPNFGSINWGTPNPGNSPLKIYVNKRLVQTALPYVTIDPSTGKNTTFVPLWDVMNTLKFMQWTSTWNGSTWYITRYATKLDLLDQLAMAIGRGNPGIGATSSPYNDLTLDDMSYLEDIRRSVPAGSSTHFGATDPVTLTLADQSTDSYLTNFPDIDPGYAPGDSPIKSKNQNRPKTWIVIRGRFCFLHTVYS